MCICTQQQHPHGNILFPSAISFEKTLKPPFVLCLENDVGNLLSAWCHSHLTPLEPIFFHGQHPMIWIQKMSGNQATLQIALWPPSLRCSLLCPENISWIERVLTSLPSWQLQDALSIDSHCRCKMFVYFLYIQICFNMFQLFWHPLINDYRRSVKQLAVLSQLQCQLTKVSWQMKAARAFIAVKH